MKSFKKITKGKQYRFIANSSDKLLVRFDKDHLKEVTSKQSTLYQLEMIKNHQLGYALTNQLDESWLIDKALKSAEFGDKAAYKYPKEKVLPMTQIFSQKTADLQAEDLLLLGNKIIKGVKSVNQDILVSASLSKAIDKSYLELSSDFFSEEEESVLTIFTEGELVSEGDILQIYDDFSWREFDFDIDEFIKSLQNKFRLAQKVASTKKGRMTVLFAPEAFLSLLSFLERALSAESVYKKVSLWKDKRGKKVADERLTLIDDPTIDFALGSTLHDDEGFAAKPLVLLERGVLQNFYTDLKNAARLKIEPNGRGFGAPALPSLTNLLLTPGEVSREVMVKAIDKGILIDQVIGGGQDNPYTGDFSLNIHLGFLIDKGEVVGRVKNMLVSGNIFEMLENKIGEISSDIKWVEGSARLPFISFLDTNIIG